MLSLQSIRDWYDNHKLARALEKGIRASLPILAVDIGIQALDELVNIHVVEAQESGDRQLSTFVPSEIKILNPYASPEDIELLKDSLRGGSEVLMSNEDFISQNTSEDGSRINYDVLHYPELLFTYTYQLANLDELGDSDMIDTKLIGWGECGAILLNKSGYFFTAAHCVEDIGVDSTDTSKSTFGVLYDPKKRTTRNIGVVARWENYDVAFGKVDLPENSNVPTVIISKADPVPGDVVVIHAYDFESDIGSGIVRRVLDSGYPVYRYNDEGELQARFVPTAEIPFEETQLLLGLYWGNVPDVNFDLDDGVFLAMAQTGPGHSGSGAFSLNGQYLSGIYLGSAPDDVINIIKLDGVEPLPKLSYLPRAMTLRRFLETFIEAAEANNKLYE